MGNFLNKNESVEQEREAIHNLLEAACTIRHDLDSISSKFGLSRPQLSVLYILTEAHPEGCSRGEIIEGMVETCPDVTRLVDRLEEEGLVERYRCEKDARVSITKITQKGIDLFEETRGAYVDYLEQMGQLLSKKESKTISKLCKKINTQLTCADKLDKSA